MFNDLRFRLRALFHPATMDAELNEELRFHLDNQVAKNLAAGMTREEATRQARIVVGGMDQIREEDHEARGAHLLETTLQDLRYGLRGMRKQPGFLLLLHLPSPWVLGRVRLSLVW